VLTVRHAEQLSRLNGYRLIVRAKLLLWFVPGAYDGDWLPNLIDGEPGDKDLHDDAQGTAEAAYVIERVCPPGGMVLDPLCGSGTTLVAARQLGRRYLGAELDRDRARVATARLRQG
jgi:site-specific DNA-methyltransferase (adenine-specific)